VVADARTILFAPRTSNTGVTDPNFLAAVEFLSVRPAAVGGVGKKQ